MYNNANSKLQDLSRLWTTPVGGCRYDIGFVEV